MHAVTVAVDYLDLLRLTLPYNRHHFDDYTIITDPASAGVQGMARLADSNRARVLVTDLFYADGAKFNKWRALEWGLDRIGRKGWLCLLDADVCWPKTADLRRILRPGFLYTPFRRMFPTIPSEVPSEGDWHAYPAHRNEGEFAGYSQVFHADDPALGPAPWHQTDWIHAGGADSFFQAKWPLHLKVRPAWSCLHLGPAGVNWLGRASAYADGTTPPDATAKQHELRGLISRRRKQPPGTARYAHERLAPTPPIAPQPQ